MRRVQLATLALTIATLAVAASATAAGATTFYVNETGADTNACTAPGAAACKTIVGAVHKAEHDPGSSTIEVAAGTYTEELLLNSAVEGLTIRGAGSGPGGTEIRGTGKGGLSVVYVPGSGVTLAGLKILDPAGQEGDAVRAGVDLTLDDVAVEVLAAGNHDGIAFGNNLAVGVLTINGGSITMGPATTGNGIDTYGYPVSVDGLAVTLANGATGSGVLGAVGPLTIANSTFTLGNTAEGGIGDEAGPVTLSNDVLTLSGPSATGLELLQPLPLSLQSVTITQTNPANGRPAVSINGGSAALANLTTTGGWKGSGVEASQSTVSVKDSHLAAGTGGGGSAILAGANSASETLLVQRSVLSAGASAGATLGSYNENTVIDSSEILGGMVGAFLGQSSGKTRTLTVSASTIDAGTLGVADAPPVYAVQAATIGGPSRAQAMIQGSVLLERQSAVIAEAGEHATVGCSYSDVPDQTVAENGKEGAVSCATGSSSNTSSAPSALFASPITGYLLNPASAAVRSVPSSAIALPYGFTPSATDLAGRPRSIAIGTNGVCPGVQDRGALQLPGEAAACTPPPGKPAGVALAVISGLTLSPASFAPAPSGATISKAHTSYGSKITWRDSQAATTTFTVLRKLPGRHQGHSCRRPSRKNRHGKRCTLLVSAATFSHRDAAGANSLHFSGRSKGRKLPAGAYELQAVARDAAGPGKAVLKAFTIR